MANINSQRPPIQVYRPMLCHSSPKKQYLNHPLSTLMTHPGRTQWKFGQPVTFTTVSFAPPFFFLNLYNHHHLSHHVVTFWDENRVSHIPGGKKKKPRNQETKEPNGDVVCNGVALSPRLLPNQVTSLDGSWVVHHGKGGGGTTLTAAWTKPHLGLHGGKDMAGL